jgi:hypothetical protein
MNTSKLALIHGNILTMDQKRPKAQAVVVQDDKIIAIGSDDQIISQIDASTEVIDLKGRTLLPGFIDCHAHPMSFGLAQKEVDCTTPPGGSIRDIIERIREAANEKQEGKWIIGRGYDDFSLKEKRHPNRWDLDVASPKNPVLITRICAHISVVNSVALKLANITKDTENPQGGQIDKDPKTGEPTGVLRERAIEIVSRIVPSTTEEELREAINRASLDFVSRGVTSVTDAGISLAAEVRAYQEAVRKDGMPLRVSMMYSLDLLPQLEALGISTGFGDKRLKVGGIKIVLDGSMTGRTAAVSHPYRDDPENTGIMYYSQDELDKLVLKAHKAGFQIGIHAIGDRAINSALDAFESALQKVPVEDHRHRIEHCGICNPTIISRLKKLRIIPVPQPIFLYGSGESYRAGLSDEGTAWSYPLGSFLKEDIPVPMSSDSLGSMDPLLGIYTAVTRKTFEGKDVGPVQRISAEEALRAYTINSAYADFDENIKGSIEIGKLADFVVLSDDPCTVDSEIIKDLKVELTIIGGKTVYRKEAIEG